MDEEKTSAFCHFGLSLKCNISDVKSVSCSAISITINLKNGKNYNIINLENGYELSKYIQKRMTLQQTILENTQDAKAAILSLKVKCKKEGIASITCFLLTIPGIILTSALTNWKELHEFGRQEWIIFSIMFAIGVLAVILMCIFLRKYLFDNDRCLKTQKALYQTLLRTAPIQPGNAIKVFLDDEYHASYRLVIFGFPNSEKVYFTAEDVDQQFEMHLFYTSQIYADMDALNPELEDMIEIPLPEVL